MNARGARVVALAAVFALAGCSGDNNDDSDAGSDELRPADEVISERESDEAIDSAVGEPVDLGAGIGVTVSGMTVGGDDLGPWLAVDVRAENRGDEDTGNPQLAIVCNGGTEEGGWQADSTYGLNDELPSETFNEGTVHLLLPGDGRFGEARPECDTPAVVRVRANGGFVVTFEDDESTDKTADVTIADDLVAALNT